MATQTTIRPFLMFSGQAEEAMNFYVSLFPKSSIAELVRYGPGQPGTEGTVIRGAFVLDGQEFLCTDSTVQHPFTFTPALSLFVSCDAAEDINRLFAALAEGGSILMPLNNYGFSKQFGWLNDRYGVSWQLNLD